MGGGARGDYDRLVKSSRKQGNTLQQFIAEDHLARGNAHVFANRKGIVFLHAGIKCIAQLAFHHVANDPELTGIRCQIE